MVCRECLLWLFLMSVLSFGTDTIANSDDPNQIEGVHQRHKVIAIGKLTSYFRDGEKILQRMVPDNAGLNRVFYICLEGQNVFTYKAGILGTEFQINEEERSLVKTPFTIKLAGDKNARVERITIYTHYFKTTLEGYWLKKNTIVPWSTAELAQWRKERGEAVR